MWRWRFVSTAPRRSAVASSSTTWSTPSSCISAPLSKSRGKETASQPRSKATRTENKSSKVRAIRILKGVAATAVTVTRHALSNCLNLFFPHADVVLNRLDKYRSLKANGTLILGQDQDAVGGNFDADQALSGKLAQFGIWDYVLTSRDVEKMAECEEEGEKGKLVASFCKTCWLTGNWIDSYQILTFPRSSLCSAAVGTDIWVLIWANKKYTTMSSTYQQLVP